MTPCSCSCSVSSSFTYASHLTLNWQKHKKKVLEKYLRILISCHAILLLKLSARLYFWTRHAGRLPAVTVIYLTPTLAYFGSTGLASPAHVGPS